MLQPTQTELIEFCNNLDEEKAYFNITYERILHSEWFIPEYRNDNLVGLAGIEKKYGIVRSWTIVKKEYWGKGIGSKLISKRLEKCRADKSCHIILGIVHENNTNSIRTITKRGYTYIGQKENLLYYGQPVSAFAPAMIFFLRVIFPVFNFVNKCRS
jgi:RimJ/RimL family protein N-acetyltransferase